MNYKKTLLATSLLSGVALAAFTLPGLLPQPVDSGTPQSLITRLLGGLSGTPSPLPGSVETPATPSLPGLSSGESPLDVPSQLDPTEVAAVLTGLAMGQDMPAELLLEVTRFVSAFPTRPGEPQAPELQAVAEQLSQFLIAAANRAGLPEELQPVAPELPAPLQPGAEAPSLKSLFQSYGLATTVGYLVASYAVPDLAPWVIPHNTRVLDTYTRTRTGTTVTGQAFTPFVSTNVAVGQSFTTTTTIDADVLTATALDQHGVTDTIAVHLPVSTSLDVNIRCTRISPALLGRRCIEFATTPSIRSNDTVIARNASYTFAFPLNAGQFPTRATAMDIFQVAYDALGQVHAQAPREFTAASPFSGVPGFEPLVPGTGLADLSTQAPAVTFFGAQVGRGALTDTVLSSLISPALNALTREGLDIRRVNAAPRALPLPVSGSGSVNDARLSTNTLLDTRFGPTAGYRVSEIRSGKPNIMIVRWHNLGSESVGRGLDSVVSRLPGLPADRPTAAQTLASAPASFSYDVPAGNYLFGEERVAGTQSVRAVDYPLAGTLPTLSVPPKLPSPDQLQQIATALQDLANPSTGNVQIPGLGVMP